MYLASVVLRSVWPKKSPQYTSLPNPSSTRADSRQSVFTAMMIATLVLCAGFVGFLAGQFSARSDYDPYLKSESQQI